MIDNIAAKMILCRADEILSSEDKWIKGNAAVDINRNPVNPEALSACSWCLIGAIDAALFETGLGNFGLGTILGALRDTKPFELSSENKFLLGQYNDDERMSFEILKGWLKKAAEKL